MFEYTIVSIGALAFFWFLNEHANPFFKNKKIVFWSLGIIVFAQLVADNWAAARGFWVFNDSVTVGVRVPVIPLENLLFGTALFLCTVFFWEWFSANPKNKKKDRID